MFFLNKKKVVFLFLSVVILIVSYVVGYRDLSVGADTSTYANKFLHGASCKCFGSSEPGFEAFLYPMYFVSLSPQNIFMIISILIYLLVFFIAVKAVRNLGGNREYGYREYIMIFSMFIMLPLVFQVHVNAIRQGLSALFLLVSFFYILESNRKVSFLYLLLSALFHYSALLIIPFYVLFFYFNFRVNYVYASSIFIFLILSFLYLLGFSEDLVRYLSGFFNIPLWDAVKSYGEFSGYKVGVRYDFYFYSFTLMLPVFLYSIYNVNVRKYFSFLVVAMIPFLILGWGAYSNRYLLNVWLYISFGVICLVFLRISFFKYFYTVFFAVSILSNFLYIKFF